MPVKKVFGDLAQPDGYLAAAVKPFQRQESLQKGFLRQLFRQLCIMAHGEQKMVDDLPIFFV